MAPGRKNKAHSILNEHVFLDELTAPAPIANLQREDAHRHDPPAQFGLGKPHRRGSKESTDHARRRSSDNRDILDNLGNLDELAAPSPVENPHERHIYRQDYLEELRSEGEEIYDGSAERDLDNNQSIAGGDHQTPDDGSRGTNSPTSTNSRLSRLVTELYIVSYLILFSILGTLARLGLQALTAYPGSPTTTSELWANVGGSAIMGFLSEDRQLFKEHGRIDNKEHERDSQHDSDGSQETAGRDVENGSNGGDDPEKEAVEARKAHTAMKKCIPLYIGLATGFCGSFTSFSSFIRDVFLQLANQRPAIQPSSSVAIPVTPRGGGYSFMAVLAVIILTVCLCLSALKAGAHLAIGLQDFIPPLPALFTSKAFHGFVVLFSWCLWLGCIFMTIWPPDRPFGPAALPSTSWKEETWRGQVLFALVFAPLGCLLRFYSSLRMNGIIASFPLGTFVVNISGTAILGVCWDLQRAPLCADGACIGGGRVGCQVLQGVQDGFCGCLTTISTWVLELMGLRRKHAYIYGGISVSVGLAFLVAIMGSLIWSRGVLPPSCST